MNKRALLTCLTLCLAQKVLCAPLDPSSNKPGAEQEHPSSPKSINLEDKVLLNEFKGKGSGHQNSGSENYVKEAVQKAEEDATRAAQEAVRRGHKAESRVEVKKEEESQSDDRQDKQEKPVLLKHVRKHAPSVSDSDEGPHIKRVKEHKVNQKPSGVGKMLGLSEMSELGGGNNDYKEDTRLEDRLAMEAEEEKKYETGEGYGGGGGGSNAGWDEGTKGVNWATNIQRQDAAEKQSIQAQVASESAHELDEIQRAIAAESQSSRGSASIGNGGASVVGGASSVVQDQEGMQPRISRPQGGQQMAFEGGRQKSLSPSENQEISSMIHQADKLSTNEMRGPEQQGAMEIGNLGARGGQEQVGLGGMEGAQQLGGSQGAPMEQVALGGSERAGLGGGMAGGMEGGAIDAGGMGQEVMAQGGLAGGGGMSEAPVSRMTAGSLGGGGMQGLQTMQGMQGIQGMQGMQGMSSAFSGGQGGMLSNVGGVAGMQGQGILGGGLQGATGLQGGLQGMVAGGIPGLESMAGGNDYGQQMAFKKSTIARPSDFQRSKTHTKEDTSSKTRKASRKDVKSASSRSPVPKKRNKKTKKAGKKNFINVKGRL